jgi:NADH-quinone oxidoreductase subunit G
MNRGDRIEAPLVFEGGRLAATNWDSAFARVSALIKNGGDAVLLASGGASVESLGQVKAMLAGTTLTAAVQLPQGEKEEPLAGVPNLAHRTELAPNGEGARMLGYGTDWSQALSKAANAKLVVLLDVTLTDAQAASFKGDVIVFGTIQHQELPNAKVVLPITNVAEENGTFVNRDKRAQRYQQARSAPGMARPAWWIAAGVRGNAATTAAEAFADVSKNAAALAGLTYNDLGFTGRVAGATVGAGA